MCLCALVSIRNMRCVVPSAGFYIPQELTADTSYQRQLLGSLKWSDSVKQEPTVTSDDSGALAGCLLHACILLPGPFSAPSLAWLRL